MELEEPLNEPGQDRRSASPQGVEFFSHHHSVGVALSEPCAIGSALGDLIHRAEERETREECEELNYEPLPVLRHQQVAGNTIFCRNQVYTCVAAVGC